MVILVFLHMARTFFFGAYKYPRELNWVIGVVAADPDDGDVVHRLPAAVRPALLLGDDRRREHQRHRPAGRPVPVATSCAPAPSSAPRRCRASTRSTCCSCPGAIVALIGAHLYLVDEARHDGAAVAEGRDPTPSCARRRREPAREGGVPPRVLDPEGAGEAVLPLRGRQGRGDGVRRDGRDHHDVDRARRRARPEGRPDDDDLHAAARVVLLLPLRAAARHQAGRASCRWRRSASRRSA